MSEEMLGGGTSHGSRWDRSSAKPAAERLWTEPRALSGRVRENRPLTGSVRFTGKMTRATKKKV